MQLDNPEGVEYTRLFYPYRVEGMNDSQPLRVPPGAMIIDPLRGYPNSTSASDSLYLHSSLLLPCIGIPVNIPRHQHHSCQHDKQSQDADQECIILQLPEGIIEAKHQDQQSSRD